MANYPVIAEDTQKFHLSTHLCFRQLMTLHDCCVMQSALIELLTFHFERVRPAHIGDIA